MTFDMDAPDTLAYDAYLVELDIKVDGTSYNETQLFDVAVSGLTCPETFIATTISGSERIRNAIGGSDGRGLYFKDAFENSKNLVDNAPSCGDIVYTIDGPPELYPDLLKI